MSCSGRLWLAAAPLWRKLSRGDLGYPSGKKTYLVQYRAGRRTRRITIGQHGVLTAEEARTQAKQLLGDVARGSDPSADKQAKRRAPTVAGLCDRFLEEYVDQHCKPTTARDYHSVMGDLSCIKKEQSIEQNPALDPDLPDGGPSGSARVGCAQPVFVSRQSFGCRQWEQFTERMFGAWIDRVLPEAIEINERGYWLPGRFPPTNKNEWPALRSWLLTEGWTLFAPSKQELCHAV